MTIDKVIRDGKVAVILRCRWGDDPVTGGVFSPGLVAGIEAGGNRTHHGFLRYSVQWVPVGTRFFIYHGDCGDMIFFENKIDWIEA